MKNILIVRIYQNRVKTVSLCRQDLTQVIKVIFLSLWLGVELLIYM